MLLLVETRHACECCDSDKVAIPDFVKVSNANPSKFRNSVMTFEKSERQPHI